MVQVRGNIMNITQLTLMENTERFIKDRQNQYWMDGGMEWYHQWSEWKQGCVALGKWHDEHHPLCRVVHEIDLLQSRGSFDY